MHVHMPFGATRGSVPQDPVLTLDRADLQVYANRFSCHTERICNKTSNLHERQIFDSKGSDGDGKQAHLGL